MRTEKEMYDLIIGTAKNDERIRAVSMCGSRCDPNAPEDEYRDYDIEYVVRDIDSFTKNAAQKLGFHYRADYEENMTAYLRMTKGIYDKNKLS